MIGSKACTGCAHNKPCVSFDDAETEGGLPPLQNPIAIGSFRRYSESMRFAVILVLIPSLLACPLRCVSGGECAVTPQMGTGTPQTPAGCCDGCGSGEIPQGEFPQPECPDDNCQACICHGATDDTSSVTEDLAASAMACCPLECHDVHSQFRLGVRFPADRLWQLPPFLNGRAARIGLQSLQI